MRIQWLQMCACIICILAILPVYPQQIQSKADYFVAEHASKLLVYNKYQQRITQKEGALFVPFIPLRIIESQSKLNDEYTLCSKIEVNGDIYYLIKNEQNVLVGSGELGFNKLYNSAELLNDTIEIVNNREVELLSPDQKYKFIIDNNSILIRYFKKNNYAYVKVNDSRSKYGWFYLDKNIEYKILRNTKNRMASEKRVSEQSIALLEKRINEVNNSFYKLYSYFNKSLSMSKEAPRWKIKVQHEKIECILEPHYYRASYQQTSLCLMKELESIYHGTNYIVLYSPGVIEIRLK